MIDHVFYCFEKDGLYWMIPISSQIDKYENCITTKCNDIMVILMEYVSDM